VAVAAASRLMAARSVPGEKARRERPHRSVTAGSDCDLKMLKDCHEVESVVAGTRVHARWARP